jgi:hypothetical protein
MAVTYTVGMYSPGNAFVVYEINKQVFPTALDDGENFIRKSGFIIMFVVSLPIAHDNTFDSLHGICLDSSKKRREGKQKW